MIVKNSIDGAGRRNINKVYTDARICHTLEYLQLYAGSVAVRAVHGNLCDIADIGDAGNESVDNSRLDILKAFRMRD